ncbi:MAG: hypothetical protein U5N58_05795 [Actinomycetota bacterium]|nr:hypothetical protein [Actinomycetota bacterium]
MKTFLPAEDIDEVVENTPVPILTIGAEKLDTDLEVLAEGYISVKKGARGIIFGRNIFMAENPHSLIKALNEVINNDVSPNDAIVKYKLN